MSQPYVLDFDGLDGIYDLDVPASVQVEIDKTHVNPEIDKARVNVESSDSSGINGDRKFTTKKQYNLFPKVALLMIGLIGYLSFISLHGDESDIEPLSKQIARSSDESVMPTESDSRPNDTQHRASESEYIKTDSTIKSPNDKQRVDGTDENPPVVTGLESNLSAPVGSVQKQQGLYVEDTTVVANAKSKAHTAINSQPKVKPQSKRLNKEVSSNSDTVAQMGTKPDLLSDRRLNSGKQTAEFVLQFSFNESTVTNLPSTKLLHLKEVAQRCPDAIQIVGHTCNLGTFLSNQAVGLVRATWVKDVLVTIGLPANRIKVVSAAHHKPAASNKTYAGRALNRRVTVGCLSHSDKMKEETR